MSYRFLKFTLLLLGLLTHRAVAQEHAFSISGDSADKVRMSQLLGRVSTDGFLLRSISSWPSASGRSAGLRFTRIHPELLTVMNTMVPFSINDGAMWAGRGVNIMSTSGFRLDWGRMKLIVLPELMYSSNSNFETNTDGKFFVPTPRTVPWDGFSDPWYFRPYSVDVPRRFGENGISRIVAGQSTFGLEFGWLETGVSTENNWWGPGIRNAILLSNNAEGFPHMFIRSARPLPTLIGVMEWRWLFGGLTESKYFDDDPSNDTRSISALGISLRPHFEPNLTLGVARSVYGTAKGWKDIPGRWLDVFRNTGRPAERPYADSSLYPGGKDQIISLFARWVFPKDGFEAYSEWARQELPKSLRDFLADPTHSHGYTLGVQWIRPVPVGQNTLRLQAEITTLEQSPSFRNRPVGVFYTSRRVIQGYTNKGQVLGGNVGPGSSGQWFALDWITTRSTIGPYFTRTRHNEDVHSIYRWPPGVGFCTHDVTTRFGLRASRRFGFGYLGVDGAVGRRWNAFFQNRSGCLPDTRIDAPSRMLSLTFRPRVRVRKD